MLQKILTILSLIILTACIKVKEHHGYEIQEENIAQLDNISTKEEVLQLLGNPIYIDNIDEDKWFYLSYVKAHSGILEPKINHYDILILSFKNDKLVDKQFHQKQHLNRLEVISETTKVYGDDDKILHNIFDNFGKYRKGK